MYNEFLLLDKLEKTHTLEEEEYKALIDGRTEELTAYLTEKAVKARKAVYGNSVFIRGLIEISNICKNDCYYCGIRRSNRACERYRLTPSQILECCEEGYKLGFRTFVLQGGEDSYFNDEILCEIIKNIKSELPHCAVTLSLGERGYDSFMRLKQAGADRYLLRHETADPEHYSRLHPKNLTLENRMSALWDLKKAGYQVGCGFMVGSPYQTSQALAKDLKFIESFSPDMCGIGPFIPHDETPFKSEKRGSAELTCFLLSLIRLIKPNVLLPSTTALASLEKDGRQRGILAGANVVMPNLSPASVRGKYGLYNNKAFLGGESAEGLEILKNQMNSIGYEVVTDRGDIKSNSF